MGTLNIVLTQADFSANYLKKGTPIIASEETADTIISLLTESNETLEDALRLFFYQLKQNGIYPKVKSLILPCISSNLDEARRNWINTSEYEEGVSYQDYGSDKGLVFDSVNKTIYRAISVQSAKNTIINPSSSLLVGDVSACFCTKGSEEPPQYSYIELTGVSYTTLGPKEITFYLDNKNNVLSIGDVNKNINHPVIGTWHCNDNDGNISAYVADGGYYSKNTKPSEWSVKNTPITNFGGVKTDTPANFILLSEGLSKEEMTTLYDIVNTFLESL